MEMNWLIHLLCTFTIVASSVERNPDDEICPYRSTVELSNQANFENGSYRYHGVIIPAGKLSFYDKHYFFGYESVEVPEHLRGCVCSDRKPCIKLCCETDEFFSTTTFRCEKLSTDFEVSWDLKIRLKNNLYKVVNVLHQFIYQVGIPCRMAESLKVDFEKWVLLENGTVSEGNELLPPLDTVNYCFTPQWSNKSEEYSLTPFSCTTETYEPWGLTVNSYAMAVSVLFLIFTIVVYLSLKELRGNLRGQMLICYLMSLAIAYGIISYINISRVILTYLKCSFLGYAGYYFFVAAFLWLSILCYDIWSNFKNNINAVQAKDNRNRFLYYSLNAWGWSIIFTILTLWADLSPSIDELYKPDIGTEMCWINTTKWSAAIYFYGPILIILVLNFITFTYLTVHIYRVRRESNKLSNKEEGLQVNSMVILRLFLIMGVAWIFDIISYFLPQTPQWQLMFTLSDFLNSLHGPLVFALFVLKRNVLNLLKKRFITPIFKVRRSTMSWTIKSNNMKSSNICETST